MSVRGRKGENLGKISPIIFMCVAGITPSLSMSPFLYVSLSLRLSFKFMLKIPYAFWHEKWLGTIMHNKSKITKLKTLQIGVTKTILIFCCIVSYFGSLFWFSRNQNLRSLYLCLHFSLFPSLSKKRVSGLLYSVSSGKPCGAHQNGHTHVNVAMVTVEGNTLGGKIAW